MSEDFNEIEAKVVENISHDWCSELKITYYRDCNDTDCRLRTRCHNALCPEPKQDPDFDDCGPRNGSHIQWMNYWWPKLYERRALDIMETSTSDKMMSRFEEHNQLDELIHRHVAIVDCLASCTTNQQWQARILAEMRSICEVLQPETVDTEALASHP
jgi:hypothetical protein